MEIPLQMESLPRIFFQTGQNVFEIFQVLIFPLKRSLLLHEIVLDTLSKIPERAFLPREKTVIDSRIRRVLEIIDRDPGAPYSIDSLSAKVKMSANNFHRHFIAGTDTSPKQYILLRRLQFAREQLMNSQKTIDEIAQKAGFTNRYHFSKGFKQYYSFPPVSYKKKMTLLSHKKANPSGTPVP